MTDAENKIEPFTVVVAASELPRAIVDKFPKRPAANARFALTVESAESDDEKLSALKRDLEAGLDDLEAGRVSEADVAFSRLNLVFGAR